MENEAGLVRFSLKHMQRRDVILQTLHPGDHLTVPVFSLTASGAYVDLGGPLGFIPYSEVCSGYIVHPADILHCGQQVTVSVEDLTIERYVLLSLLHTSLS